MERGGLILGSLTYLSMLPQLLLLPEHIKIKFNLFHSKQVEKVRLLVVSASHQPATNHTLPK
jgi:hypothetical protein